MGIVKVAGPAAVVLPIEVTPSAYCAGGPKDTGCYRMAQHDLSWPRDALPAGTALFGYRIEAVIGRGGFGITYRAVDGIDQVFAIKECFPKQFAVRQGLEVLPSDQESVEPFADCLSRFGQEARALRQLAALGAAGDGVVKVATFFQANGTAYVVMEFLGGQSLDRAIKTAASGLDPERVDFILPRLLHAVGCVHSAGLLHRDIKPANIILRPDNSPVLIDFGAARTASQGRTVTFTQIFSEGYAPIEQFSGTRQGPFSDIYALGATLYRAIGGAPVDSFTRHQALLRGKRDPQPLAAEAGAGRYSHALLAAIDAAMVVAPEERPQSVADLFGLLQHDPSTGPTVRVPRPAEPAPRAAAAEVPRPVLDSPPQVSEQPRAQRRLVGRSLAVAGLLGVALLAIGVAAGGLGLPWSGVRQTPGAAASAEAPVIEQDAAAKRAEAENAARQKAEDDEANAAMQKAAEDKAAAQKAEGAKLAEQKARQAREQATQLRIRAHDVLSGLGLKDEGLETADAAIGDADDEVSKGDFARASDGFAAVSAKILILTKNILGAESSAYASVAKRKMQDGDLQGAQSALSSAKQIKQAANDFSAAGLEATGSPTQDGDASKAAGSRFAAAKESAVFWQSKAESAVAALALQISDFLADVEPLLAQAEAEASNGALEQAAVDYNRAAAMIVRETHDVLGGQAAAYASISKRKMQSGDLAGAQQALDMAKKIKQSSEEFH